MMPVLGAKRQSAICEFQVISVHIVSSKTPRVTCRDPHRCKGLIYSLSVDIDLQFKLLRTLKWGIPDYCSLSLVTQ